MKLALGSNQYYWPKQAIFDFYQEILSTPVDIVYLGETVCSKRRELRTEEWIELAATLASAGKEVVLSTLTLLEASSDIKTLRALAKQDAFLLEANDMAAVHILSEQKLPFIAGLGINIYNAETLSFLQQLGMQRWICPVELSKDSLSHLLSSMNTEGLETELFAFGRLPLAYSARCFTARAHNLPKDQCQRKCIEYPNGLPLYSQEAQHFLHINGIQTQSGNIYHLLPELDSIGTLPIDILRLSPQPKHMSDIIQHYHHALLGAIAPQHPVTHWIDGDLCDGFWHGREGMTYSAQDADCMANA